MGKKWVMKVDESIREVIKEVARKVEKDMQDVTWDDIVRYKLGGMSRDVKNIIAAIENQIKEGILDILSKELSNINSKLEEILNILQSTQIQHAKGKSGKKKKFPVFDIKFEMETNIEGLTLAIAYSKKNRTLCIYANNYNTQKHYCLGKLVDVYTDMGTRVGFDVEFFDNELKQLSEDLGLSENDIRRFVGTYLEYLESVRDDIYRMLKEYGLSVEDIKKTG